MLEDVTIISFGYNINNAASLVLAMLFLKIGVISRVRRLVTSAEAGSQRAGFGGMSQGPVLSQSLQHTGAQENRSGAEQRGSVFGPVCLASVSVNTTSCSPLCTPQSSPASERITPSQFREASCQQDDFCANRNGQEASRPSDGCALPARDLTCMK